MQKENISYEDFIKVDIRVGFIKSAKRIPKKDRLLELEVDLGELGVRTIVAGIAEHFSPETLMDKYFEYPEMATKVLVVVNLEPKKVGGVMSHGMILAGYDNEKHLRLAECDLDAGSEIG